MFLGTQIKGNSFVVEIANFIATKFLETQVKGNSFIMKYLFILDYDITWTGLYIVVIKGFPVVLTEM